MNDQRNTAQPITTARAIASAIAVAAPMVSVTYPATRPAGAAEGRTMPLSVQDQAWVESKIEARLAEHKTDVKLNTQGLADLKDRFKELNDKMASVPSDLTHVKATMATARELGELGDKITTRMQRYMTLLGVLIAGTGLAVKLL